MRMILLALALSLSACSLTIEERDAVRETGFNFAMVAVEALQAVGVNPLADVDPKVLKYANAACVMLSASSPTIVAVINRLVDDHNKGLALDALQTERTTVAEFTAGLEVICTIIRQVLEPTIVLTPEEPV